MTLLLACNEADFAHIELYNASSDVVTAIVNAETYKVNPNETAYISSKEKEQFFEYGIEKQLIKTDEHERFLVNLQKDTIIRLELLYDNTIGKGTNVVQEGNIAYKIIKLRDKKYYLPAEIIKDQLVFKDYDFSVGEKALASLESGKNKSKINNYRKDWKGYYKLFSIEELMQSYMAINREPTFVQQTMNASIKILNPEYKFRLMNESARVVQKGKSIGSLGVARVSNDDVIEFDKPEMASGESVGSIKEIIAKIPRCNITSAGKMLHKEVSVDVVILENSPGTKLVVR